MTKVPEATCNCIDTIEQDLKAKFPSENTKLTLNMFGPRRAFIATCKRDDKVRKKPSYMIATFCPFCGKKYENDEGAIG